jgi:Flp pilus assembly protein CpaB
VVVRTPVAAGQVVGDESVEHRSVPDGLRPPGAATDPSEVVGRTAAVDLAVGEVVRTSRLAPDEAPGVAAVLPPGRRGLPVALALPVPGLQAGQRVDLVAAEPATGRAATVAEGAPVLEVTEDVVLVSVSSAEVPAVAAAVGAGLVAVAIVGSAP